MRENKVIYGLIGYGGMGRWHTEILSNVPEIEIGGIYDIAVAFFLLSVESPVKPF